MSLLAIEIICAVIGGLLIFGGGQYIYYVWRYGPPSSPRAPDPKEHR